MQVRSTKLLAVLTAAVLTLASGTIQAYASFCQPAEKVTQEACCPNGDHGVQAEDCEMDGCDCSFDSQPTEQKDSPATVSAKAPSWDVPMTEESERTPSFDDEAPISEIVVTYRDRAPPTGPDLSGNGLRAPPSQRA
ncbi:MAG: hypothetical protein IH944_00560 [Armatimonadetes bacterium]|nr:hypothetical protein [Armatimonadota bacterium]